MHEGSSTSQLRVTTIWERSPNIDLVLLLNAHLAFHTGDERVEIGKEREIASEKKRREET